MITSSMGEHKFLAFGSVAVLATGLSMLLWYRKHRNSSPPTKWTKVGEVSALYLYPIKSCRGIEASTLEVTDTGFKLDELRDRMFVVVTSDGEFVTGRSQPKLTQVTAALSSGKLRLSMDGVRSRDVDFAALPNNPQTVRIWKSLAEGIDCGDAAAEWLSKAILGTNSGLRLLRYAREDKAKEPHPKVSQMAKDDYKAKDAALFSDAVSFHLISEASVAELNSRLDGENVTPRAFRPNVVVAGDGLEPFAEDYWDWIKVGDVVFKYLSPCSRCLFTTVDPETGKKSEKSEPLATLRKYRYSRDPRHKNVLESPIMGIYLAARSGGSVSVGDDVMVPAR